MDHQMWAHAVTWMHACMIRSNNHHVNLFLCFTLSKTCPWCYDINLRIWDTKLKVKRPLGPDYLIDLISNWQYLNCQVGDVATILAAQSKDEPTNWICVAPMGGLFWETVASETTIVYICFWRLGWETALFSRQTSHFQHVMDLIYQEATEPGHGVLATPLDHCKCCFINISKMPKQKAAFVISSAENILVWTLPSGNLT